MAQFPLQDYDRVVDADGAGGEDGGVDADLDVVEFGGGFEDAGVFGEIALGEGGHDAARARPRDRKPDLADP